MPEPSRYDRFITDFNAVEAHFKQALYGNKDAGDPGFRRLLDQYRRKFPRRITEALAREFGLLADVRNSLTHGEGKDGRRLAEPTETAIKAMKDAHDHLLQSPSVLTAFNRPKPYVVSPDMSVQQALREMYSQDFSQVPIYGDGGYEGLLTTNTIARWIAHQFETTDGYAADSTVGVVAKEFTEDTEVVEHAPRSLTVTGAIARFEAAIPRGAPLTAILISHSGKPSDTPLAIVVAADLPRLLAL